MLSSSLAPNAVTVDIVVRSLSSGYAFIDEMRRDFALKPDLVTYTILIDNVCNSKNLREATRLVAILLRKGFKRGGGPAPPATAR
uniref:Pentatricopeptide repeat-containing protein At2g17670 family n=1 Tax=Cajanus cajan TaxID=3821 RepID=A0A151UEV6_CAJCA